MRSTLRSQRKPGGARQKQDRLNAAQLVPTPRKPRFAIDLRSEVMVPPTEAMWEAMQEASTTVEWPFGDRDHHVAMLEDECARRLGHEAAAFLPTTSMANLAALLALSAPGQQILLGTRSHIYCFERQNVATVGGRVPRAVDENRLGELPLEAVKARLEAGPYVTKPSAAAIVIENTHNIAGGTCLSQRYVEAVSELARTEGIAVYVDGARLANSAVAQKVPWASLAGPADAVAISLNKGLGAPYGAILAGQRAVVEAAREHVWNFGGHSVHRAGMFAAAALVALETGTAEVERDHVTARALATELAAVDGATVDLELVRTNIVRVELGAGLLGAAVVERLGKLGVGAGLSEPHAIRFVTHRGFEVDDVPTVRLALAEAIAMCRDHSEALEVS